MERKWTLATHHFWQNPEHINSVEASMGVMALQLLIEEQTFDSQTLFITDLKMHPVRDDQGPISININSFTM